MPALCLKRHYFFFLTADFLTAGLRLGALSRNIWALRAICDGTYTKKSINGWNERLSKVFNRGFWDGYYMGQRLGEWPAKYGSSATRVKKYVAKGIRYYSKLSVAEFLMEAGEPHVGDDACIIGPRREDRQGRALLHRRARENTPQRQTLPMATCHPKRCHAPTADNN